jgi:hypothetical protein
MLDELEKTAWRGRAPRVGRLWCGSGALFISPRRRCRHVDLGHAAMVRASRHEDGGDHGSWAWIWRQQHDDTGCGGDEQGPDLGSTGLDLGSVVFFLFFKIIFSRRLT